MLYIKQIVLRMHILNDGGGRLCRVSANGELSVVLSGLEQG